MCNKSYRLRFKNTISTVLKGVRYDNKTAVTSSFKGY